ncbi:MAG TPA: ABC transporter ATP-binding protein [Dysgonomonas sp.]|uniref:ABC transporter ATP-binding protein n=1 Tax=unclassified Dysgonomonas TaxID=2630389 RepID=UPI0025C4FFC8|nr:MULTISPECIES: ABC transporter ATP-binding protein [unclassified Dysgonomonas]HML65688.1 ABC transporter ATP-binding protein [Dysgonomonas sp.]
MKIYWQILKKYKTSLIISPVLVLITVLCETIQPWFMANIVDDGVVHRNLSVITEIGAYMVGISILGLIVSIINVYVSSQASIGFGTDLRSKLFSKIQQLSFTEIDRFNSASLITRLTNDISHIQQVVLMSMRLLLRSPLMLVMSFFFVIKINTDLAFIMLGVVPILSISIFLIMYKGLPLFMKVQQKIDQLNAMVRENLINIRVVKSFVREDFETKKFEKRSEDLQNMVVNASNVIIAIFPVMQLIMNISVIVVLWVGGAKAIEGNLKVGELISFVNYMTQILMALMFLSMVIVNIARASASSERILEVIKTEPSLTNTEEGLSNKHKITKGEVIFRNVFFRYNGGENDVLKDINFQIKQGETIAVVGATGSAKSSMLQLIPRLYDVTAGEILIDGVNVKDYNLEELHAEIGMVLQKNELFTGTIIDNLRWGRPDATIEEIEEAAKAAQAHDFIVSFTDGYNTLLGRGGINVSGGQKQRICIARALLRKPKILILDDSTSAVDTETEQKIRYNLNNLLKDTTVFIITQRINTMQSADRVIVLEDGEIDVIGKPDELIEKSKLYQEIYNSQQIVY